MNPKMCCLSAVVSLFIIYQVLSAIFASPIPFRPLLPPGAIPPPPPPPTMIGSSKMLLPHDTPKPPNIMGIVFKTGTPTTAPMNKNT